MSLHFDPTKHRQTKYSVPSSEVLAVMRLYEWLPAKDISCRLAAKGYQISAAALGKRLADIWKGGLKLRRKVESNKVFWQVR